MNFPVGWAALANNHHINPAILTIAHEGGRRYNPFMSTITVVLEADADGTLHRPLPAELRHGKVKVVATLESEPAATTSKSGTPLEALKELRKLGTFKDIADPVAWQRVQRQDRPLPGRD